MKKYLKVSVCCFSLFLIALACTKEVGLITEVEFELTEQHTAEGYVNQGLPSTFTIVPEEVLEDYEYNITYEILDGEGHFEDMEGNPLESGKGWSMPTGLSAPLLYKGSATGEHRVRITGADNFGISEDIEVMYELSDVPVVWEASSEFSQLELEKPVALSLLLETDEASQDVDYETIYGFASGSGSLEPSEENGYAPNGEYGPISAGTYPLVFTPSELGPQRLVFTLRDSNGQEIETGLDFNVSEFIEVISITLSSQDTIKMKLGDEIPPAFVFEPSNATDQEVTVVSSDPDVVFIDENNVCIAVGLGTAQVTVTSVSNPDASDTVTVEVIPPDRVPVTSITVSQEDAGATGAQRKLVAAVLPQNATDPSVSWSSGDDTIASVDDNGLLTGLSAGTVTITATSVSDPDVTGSVIVEITGVSLLSANDIEAFALNGQIETATIDTQAHTVSVTVPEGTLLSVAPIMLTVSEGATVEPGLLQARDFGSPVQYTVTSGNGTEQVWAVTASVLTIPVVGGNDILAFELPGQNASDIDTDNRTVTVNVPDGTDLNVAPSVMVVSPDATVDPAINIVRDFSSAVTYTVTAENGTQRTWQVNVTVSPDDTAPIIELIGSNPQELTLGGTYNDPGATANDNVDGDMTGSIVVDQSGVDTSTIGTYEVTYNVMDSAGNPADEVIRTVRVVTAPDTTPPVIDLIGGDVEITVGQNYNDPGATANDNVDGDITGSIVVDQSGVDTSTIGTYEVTYNVMDSAGNPADEVIRTVRVVTAPDTTPPVIDLIGGDVEITVGQNYNDPGATANDNVDGDITGSIVVDQSGVDTSTIGTYEVTYNVMDSAGNPADEVIRTVRVVTAPDTTPPVIDLIGGDVEITVGQNYNDPGATANDNVDGDITGSIVVDQSGVDTSTIGTYEVTYNVMDSAGNPADEVIRTVRVVTAPDTTPPVIDLIGGDVEITVGQNYNDPGATANDNVDGDMTGSIVVDQSGVDTSTIGTYEVTYNVMDSAGNEALEKTRFVNVTAALDETAPEITLVGGTVNLTVGETYIEPGYSAMDNVDGNITGSVVVSGHPNMNVADSYTVTYNVMDGAGNTAQEKTRIVNVTAVLDETAPEITLVGGTVNLSVGNTYIEPGYSAMDDVDGNISGSVVVSGLPDMSVADSYTVTYNVMDAAGNAAQGKTRIVNVTPAPDETAPEITLFGGTENLTVGGTYVEPGYSAMDDVDGDITASVVVSGLPNMNVADSYTVTYNVVDAAGNGAQEMTRIVNVTAALDETAPEITLVGGTVNRTRGATYVDPGYSATDNIDGDITANVVVSGLPNMSVVGSYTVTYNVSDLAGNPAPQKTRRVNVTAPQVTITYNESTGVYTAPGGSRVTVTLRSYGAGKGNASVSGGGSAYTSWNGSDSTEFTETDFYEFDMPSSGNVTFSSSHMEIIPTSQSSVTIENDEGATKSFTLVKNNGIP